MREYRKFYIDGQWVEPAQPQTLDVINPATEEPSPAPFRSARRADVDRAVAAARRAFETFSQTTPRGARGAARAHHRRLPAPPRRDGAGDLARRWARRS